jgi:hypothetical protein
VADLAAQIAAQHGLAEIEARAIGNMAIARSEADARAGLAAFEEAIAIARRNGQRAMMINSSSNYGWLAFLAGEWDSGVAVLTELVGPDVTGRGRILAFSNLLLIQAYRGESIEDGLAEMERLANEMSGPERESLLKDVQAHQAMARNDLKLAHELFKWEANHDLSYSSEFFARAIRAALWRGDGSDAREMLEKFDSSGAASPYALAHRATMVASLAAFEGRTSEALSLFRDALARWRDIHMAWEEAMAGVDMAVLLDPSVPEVAQAAADARSILERLRAKPVLEVLDAAIARAPRRVRSAEPAVDQVALAQ